MTTTVHPPIRFAHVGLPKSASTWLQTGLFRHHPDLFVFGSLPGRHPLAALNALAALPT